MANQREELFRDGFCKFDQILEPAMLRDCREACDRLLRRAERQHFVEQKSTGSLIELFEDSFFAGLVAYSPALDCLRKMGFGDIRWQSGYVISKPPHSPPLFWHQDWWGWDDPTSYEEKPQQLFFMYYMVDTNRENGCLRVVPGSHRKPHPMHVRVPNAHTPELRSMQDPHHPAYQVAEGEVDLPVQAGDLVIGDARLLHAAHGNQSDSVRPNITLWYHPDFNSLSEPVRAHIMKRHPFPEAWLPLTETILKGLVPDYAGQVPPLAENRIPGRFSSPG